MPRGIAHKHANLTIFHLAQGATILPRDPHGVLALFDKARLIEHQDALGITHGLGHELMVIPQHLLLIPPDITDKPLEPTDRPPFDMEGHGLNRLAFELAELANHIVKEMGPWLTARKTVVKGGLERPQFVHEAFHITRDEVKRGNGKFITIGPTGW
jgi:hypothetical protein